jgi:aspartate dehydrogenase
MILLWQNHRFPGKFHMRVALLGRGTIAGLVLDHVRRGELPGIEIVAMTGRGDGRDVLLAARPQVVLEAASHDAVREHLVPLLEAGVGVIVLSAGALADEALRTRAEAASRANGALLYVPSGGIGGLDALKTACLAGVDDVSIRVAKPPKAWEGIPYVEGLGIDLASLKGPKILFDGSARDGVPHFPQNVNIAAVLSMAGIGFDRTRLEVVADPALTRNTHTVRVSGRSGRFTVVLENVPAPNNPKTAWLACYSALAALKELESKVKYGT